MLKLSPEAMLEESPEATRVTPLDTALMSLPEKKNSPQIPSVKGDRKANSASLNVFATKHKTSFKLL